MTPKDSLPWQLFLDDERMPKTNRNWIIARSVAEAQKLILEKGMPEFISFDHDLGENQPTGHDFAKWLVEEDLNGTIEIPTHFGFNVHSANPPGQANIFSLMKNYLKHKLSSNGL